MDDEAHVVANGMLATARTTLLENVDGLTLEEWLDTAGGYRSILGLMKHVAGWAAVYHSYAFDAEPRHFEGTDWPRGLNDTIEPTLGYAEEIVAWFRSTCDAWTDALRRSDDLTAEHPVHWGGTMPLHEILAIVTQHFAYHAGEINEILALRRQEAFEYGEQVEENHVSTVGHRVRTDWMDDAFVERHST